MHLQWPPGLEIQAPRGLSGASESHACNAANDSEVGTKARTLDPFDAFDSLNGLDSEAPASGVGGLSLKSWGPL